MVTLKALLSQLWSHGADLESVLGDSSLHFATEYSQPLPVWPRCVLVTTKGSGDALRIQHLLRALLAAISAGRSEPNISLVPSPMKSQENGFWLASFQQ